MKLLSHVQTNPLSLRFTFLIAKNESEEIYETVLTAAGAQSAANLDQNKLEAAFQQALISVKAGEIQDLCQKEIKKSKPKTKIIDVQVVPNSFEYLENGVQLELFVDLLPSVNLEKVKEIDFKKYQKRFESKLATQESYIENRKKQILLEFNFLVETFDKIENGSAVSFTLESEKLETQNVSAIIGFNQLPEILEGELTGMASGESKTVFLKIPEISLNLENYTIKISAIQKLKYSSLTDLYASLDSVLLKSYAASLESLEMLLQKEYLELRIEELKSFEMASLSADLLKLVPEFDLPVEKIETQVKEIIKQINLAILSQKVNFSDGLRLLGFNSKAKDADELRLELTEAISSEIRFTYILQSLIQETPEITTPADSQIKTMAEIMATTPAKYGLRANSNQSEIIKQATQRLLAESLYLYFTRG